MKTTVFGPTFALIVMTFMLLSGALVRAQSGLRVSCLPDKAVALPGEALDMTVWVASATGPVTKNVTARWETTAGRIEAQGTGARWLLEGAQVERRHTAIVSVAVDGVPAGACSLGVWLAQPPPASGTPLEPGGLASSIRLRGEYITRRAFLRPGQVGERGFGLYSYFLMREPADAVARARVASFVAAFLDALVGISDQENYVERRRLNGSYMPVTMDPPAGLTAEARTAWTLDHYDFEQARRFLSLYPTLSGQGPFIIAVPQPLRSPVKPMLPWDFSQLDDAATGEGVHRFLNQAAQLYDWQNQSALQNLRDQLLTTVAGMFVGRAAAESWIQIVR